MFLLFFLLETKYGLTVWSSTDSGPSGLFGSVFGARFVFMQKVGSAFDDFCTRDEQ